GRRVSDFRGEAFRGKDFLAVGLCRMALFIMVGATRLGKCYRSPNRISARVAFATKTRKAPRFASPVGGLANGFGAESHPSRFTGKCLFFNRSGTRGKT